MNQGCVRRDTIKTTCSEAYECPSTSDFFLLKNRAPVPPNPLGYCNHHVPVKYTPFSDTCVILCLKTQRNVPVCEQTITSFPANNSGTAHRCEALGRTNPSRSKASKSASSNLAAFQDSPNSSKGGRGLTSLLLFSSHPRKLWTTYGQFRIITKIIIPK